jgi:hypothetical protein
MIFCLPTVFQKTKIPVDIAGGISHYLEECRRAYVIRTGAGDKNASRAEQLEGAQVELLVATEGGIELAAALSESWRIEHYDVILRTLSGIIAQQIERISFDPLDFALIQSGILVGHLQGWTGAIDTGNRITVRGEVEREASVIAKDVESFAASILCGSGIVFALIQERSRLWPASAS